jgi:hypothetical protein
MVAFNVVDGIVALLFTILCLLGIFANLTVTIIFVKNKKLLQLSIGYFVLFIAINDTILCLLFSGAALIRWQHLFNIDVMSQYLCFWENGGK